MPTATEMLALLPDKDEKLQFVIDLGKNAPGLPADALTQANIVEGCQSQVWLVSEFKEGLCVFTADSDAVITRGLAALVVEVYSARTPESILTEAGNPLEAVGLPQLLTPNRRNGLASLVGRIRAYATQCAAQSE